MVNFYALVFKNLGLGKVDFVSPLPTNSVKLFFEEKKNFLEMPTEFMAHRAVKLFFEEKKTFWKCPLSSWLTEHWNSWVCSSLFTAFELITYTCTGIIVF